MPNIMHHSLYSGDSARFDPFFNVGDGFDWSSNSGMCPFSMEMENAPTIRMDFSESDRLILVRAEIPGIITQLGGHYACR